jgi:hypothetical protein
MGLDISILKSTLAILAVAVVAIFLAGSSTNSTTLIDSGMTLALWILVAVVLVMFIIDLPRYLK